MTRIALTVLILLPLCLPRSVAYADGAADKQEASQRFQKGVELYGRGDVRAALIEFKRAYKLVPSYQLLYNMAQAASELRDYVEAYEHYKRYLADGGGKIAAGRKDEVEAHILQLEGYLATIDLEVSVDGAEISIDGVVVGVAPLSEPAVVSAGRRKISVTRSGYASWERYLDLAGKDTESLEVKLISLSAPKSETSSSRVAKASGLGTGFWVSATTTVLLAAGTGYMAYRTSKASDDYDTQLSKVPNSQRAIDDAAKDLRREALLTDLGIGLTAVGLVSTVIFATVGGESRETNRVSLSVGPGQVALGGTF